MMLSICTFPMRPEKKSSSVTAALMSRRAGRRSSSLDSLAERPSVAVQLEMCGD